MIVETYGFLMLHTKDILDVEAKELTMRGIEISKHLERKEPIPARITVHMLRESILSHMKLANGFVICDFPPDVQTGKLFEKEVCKPTRILFLRGTIVTMKKRALRRTRSQKLLQILQGTMEQDNAEKELLKAESVLRITSLTSSPRNNMQPQSVKRHKIDTDVVSKMKRSNTSPPTESLGSKRPKSPQSVKRRALEKMKTPGKTNKPLKYSEPGNSNELEKYKKQIIIKIAEKGRELGRKNISKLSREQEKSKEQKATSLIKGKKISQNTVRQFLKDVDPTNSKKSNKRLSTQSQGSRTSTIHGSQAKGKKHRSDASNKSKSVKTKGTGAEKSRILSKTPNSLLMSKGFQSKENVKKTSLRETNLINQRQVEPRTTTAASKKNTSKLIEYPPLRRSKDTATHDTYKSQMITGLLGTPLPSKRKKGSGIHLPHKETIRNEFKIIPEIPKIFSKENLGEEERQNAQGGDSFDEEWEQKVQYFYGTSADILMHFGDNITQINADRPPTAVFESVMRTINEICVVKGLGHLVVPLEHFKTQIV